MMVQLQEEASIKALTEDLDPRKIDEEVKTGPIEDLEDLSVDESSKILKIGIKLQEPVRAEMIVFLESNLDIFA